MRSIFLTQLLTNLEDEIFLKGGSVVTPPKIWPCFNELKFLPGIKTLDF